MRESTVGRINKAKTHCPQGHAYDIGNTYIWRRKRYCRACTNVRSKATHAKRRAAEKADRESQ